MRMQELKFRLNEIILIWRGPAPAEIHEMSVLVTGGAGYIGGHMTLGLIDAGEKVVVVDNLSTGFASAVPEAATLAVGDFGDSALIGRLLEEHEIDAIAHFAAKIVVPESVRDPLGY